MSNALRSRILAAALVLPAACAAGWINAEAAQAPAAGRFLVATRGQQGFFAKTVILLVRYGPKGAFGVIVNRPTKFPLAKLLPDVAELQGRPDLIYVGGPVSLSRLTLLIRSKTPPPDAVHVTDDLYASGSLKALRAVAGGKLAGASFRGYAGYAGWAAGQLESEIERGGWHVVSADADDVFSKDPSGLWQRLIARKQTRLVDADRPRRSSGSYPAADVRAFAGGVQGEP